jgi:hypothetical protein
LESYVAEGEDMLDDDGAYNNHNNNSYIDQRRDGYGSPSRSGSRYSNNHHQHQHQHTSPLRSLAAAGGGGLNTVGRKLHNSRVQRLEEAIYDVRSQLQGCENDIREVKATVISRVRSGGLSPVKGMHLGSHHHQHQHPHPHPHHQDYQYGAGPETDEGGEQTARSTSQELRSVQRKLKKLAENTTRACRSLSSGLTDVQQATLNLYTWSDSAHDAFGKVAHQLGMKGNPCPRARVYQPPSKSAPVPVTADDLFQD